MNKQELTDFIKKLESVTENNTNELIDEYLTKALLNLDAVKAILDSQGKDEI